MTAHHDLQVPFRGLLLAGLVIFATGCEGDVTYDLSWRFDDDPELATAARCGAHGVESFQVTETNDAGDAVRTQVLCAPGQVARQIPAGQWFVSLLGLDARSRPSLGVAGVAAPGMNVSGMVGPVGIAGGTPRTQVLIVVSHRPQCSDGIDNDADGAVDGDDPGCLSGVVE